MSDIRKELRIIATLDDSKFKKQMEEFKQSMGKGFKINFADQSNKESLKGLFKDLAKEFSVELRKALKDVRVQREGRLGVSAQSDTADDYIKQAKKERSEKQQTFHERALSMMGRVPSSVKAAGIGAGVGLLASKAVSELTDIRRAYAQREQAQTLDIMHNRGLEGAVRQSGRGLNITSGLTAAGSAATYGAIGAGIGSFAGPVGTIAGGLLGGGYGAIKGYFAGGETEAETRALKARPALEALQAARDLRGTRVEARAGGVSPQTLDRLQERGTQFGFGPQESLQQFMSARQYLGGRTAGNALPQFQEMQRRVGVGVDEQARAAEILGGAGRTGTASGAMQTVEILKKGVSAGLDASKSGQFLKTTADFVQGQTGFAQLDTAQIADRLAQSTFQFARGGEATQTQLDQAKAMQETMRNMSGTTEGLAGGMNITGALSAAQGAGINLDTFQAMALAKSSNMGEGTIKQILQETGASPDQIDQATRAIMNQKETMPETTAGMLFGQQGANMPSRQIFTGGQLGVQGFGEDIAGFYGARQFQGPMPQGMIPGMPQGPEMQSLQVEATKNQQVFVEGLDLMTKETNNVAKELNNVAQRIRDAAKYIEDVIGPSNSTVGRSTQ